MFILYAAIFVLLATMLTTGSVTFESDTMIGYRD